MLATITPCSEAFFISTSNDALDHAIDAAYHQTGLKQKEEMITRYTENKAKAYVKKWDIEKEVAGMFFLYKTIQTRRLPIKLTGGRLLTIEQDRCTISFPIDWR